jgi:uncharacterized protein (TIGR02594 family)
MLQNAFALAGQQIGLDENTQAAAVRDYLHNGGVNLDPQTYAWCAAFVNATLQQSGMKGTGSNMARSFLEWGQPTENPAQGDIAVFRRPGDETNTFGHVGFFAGFNPDGSIRVLGGNQGDKVSYGNYSREDLLGFRHDGTNALGPQQPQAPQNALQFQYKGGIDPSLFANTLAPMTNALGGPYA